MKKLVVLLNLALLLILFVTPSIVSAQGPAAITVYALKSNMAVTENQALRYVADIYTNGYINQTFLSSQSDTADRMDYMRQWATAGFDPNSADAFIYSVLLPNSTTVENTATWFGHPIVKTDDTYIIKGWFTDGSDAVMDFSTWGDPRTGLIQ
ncbi:MAG: hypothetical protein WB588_05385 [Dehalococcoidia bacterium]|jgi:hypothetical protein